MKDDTCIFCKLANGDIPTNSIYEDEDFNVILDASPASRGHALILPKEHYADLYEIDPELLGKAVKLGKRIVEHETKVLGADGYHLLQNNKPAAGQTVFHYHLHLIPRYESAEDADMLLWEHKEFADEQMKELCASMKL